MIPWEISINTESENATSGDRSDSIDHWTIQRLLDWTTGYFREKGFDQARLDAEILLAETLGCQRIDLYTRFNEEPEPKVRDIFRDWVARHAEGEPVAYLVGHREFFSLKFRIDQNVLIPRPETEHLVTEALDAMKAFDSTDPVRVVDVGTGSGNVAIAICKHAPAVEMLACDISPQALEIARENAETNGIRQGIRFLVSDLLAEVPEPERFHLIVSNPPYIGLSEEKTLDRSVVDFEPRQALFSSGPDGTGTIARLVQQAPDRLETGGWLMFEISPMIADRCKDLIESAQSLEFVRIVNDLAGHQRVVVARRI